MDCTALCQRLEMTLTPEWKNSSFYWIPESTEAAIGPEGRERIRDVKRQLIAVFGRQLQVQVDALDAGESPLNVSQILAIHNAVMQPLAIWHGPCATGKTLALLVLILLLLEAPRLPRLTASPPQNKHCKILITGPSNKCKYSGTRVLWDFTTF